MHVGVLGVGQQCVGRSLLTVQCDSSSQGRASCRVRSLRRSITLSPPTLLSCAVQVHPEHLRDVWRGPVRGVGVAGGGVGWKRGALVCACACVGVRCACACVVRACACVRARDSVCVRVRVKRVSCFQHSSCWVCGWVGTVRRSWPVAPTARRLPSPPNQRASTGCPTTSLRGAEQAAARAPRSSSSSSSNGGEGGGGSGGRRADSRHPPRMPRRWARTLAGQRAPRIPARALGVPPRTHHAGEPAAIAGPFSPAGPLPSSHWPRRRIWHVGARPHGGHRGQ
jgi:hypothetical protein